MIVCPWRTHNTCGAILHTIGVVPATRGRKRELSGQEVWCYITPISDRKRWNDGAPGSGFGALTVGRGKGEKRWGCLQIHSNWFKLHQQEEHRTAAYRAVAFRCQWWCCGGGC
jgi:hypothetical protein